MGSLWGAHFSKNSVSLEQIEIFQFCLKIRHLWRLPHPWVGVWVGEPPQMLNLQTELKYLDSF